MATAFAQDDAEAARAQWCRVGTVVCARKSVIRDWIAEQERRGWQRERRASNETEGV
jgi:hypothetical protein